MLEKRAEETGNIKECLAEVGSQFMEKCKALNNGFQVIQRSRQNVEQ